LPNQSLLNFIDISEVSLRNSLEQMIKSDVLYNVDLLKLHPTAVLRGNVNGK
jgi:hypothetical protein